MAARKRPRFLLDLAEELTWLNQKAGAQVAERWPGNMNLVVLEMEP